eukprot:g66.t1
MKEVYRRLMYGMESSALDIWKWVVARERQRSEEHIWSAQLKHLEEQKKQEMEAMRMQYEMQLKQLQTHAEEVQQARLRKFISHWRGKSEERCFHHWSHTTKVCKRQRYIIAKFSSAWRHRHKASAYRTWKEHVSEIVHIRWMTAKVIRRYERALESRCFRAIQKEASQNRAQRRLLKRFGGRLRMLKEASVWHSWQHFVELRQNARQWLNKMVQRWSTGCLSRGFRAWISFSLRWVQHHEAEKHRQEVEAQRRRQNALEVSRREKFAAKTLRHLMQRGKAHAFRTWSENVQNIRSQRISMQKFVARMSKHTETRAFERWVEFHREIRLMVHILYRLCNIKVLSAFRKWQEVDRMSMKFSVDVLMEENQRLKGEVEMLRGWKLAKLRRTVASWRSRDQLHYFVRWRNGVLKELEEKKICRSVFLHFLNRELSLGFKRWLAATRKLAQEKAELEAKRATARKAFLHFMNREMSSAFKIWVHFSREATYEGLKLRNLQHFEHLAHCFEDLFKELTLAETFEDSMRIMSSQTALAALGADCLVLFINDKEEEIFYTMDFRNNRKVRFSLENAPGLVGKVLSLDTVIVSPDAVGERDFDESVDDFPVPVKKRRRAAEQVAMIAVPIYDTKDDTIIGALKATAAMVFNETAVHVIFQQAKRI